MRLLAQKGAAVAGPLMCDCEPIIHSLRPDEWGLYLVTTDLSFFQFRGGFETGLLHHGCALLFHALLQVVALSPAEAWHDPDCNPQLSWEW